MEAILATTAPPSVNEVFTGGEIASNVTSNNPDDISDIGDNNNNDTDTVGNDESNSLIDNIINTNNEDQGCGCGLLEL